MQIILEDLHVNKISVKYKIR